MKKVTILIPCYNEEQNLPMLYSHLRQLMADESGYDWEILFVNDGSRDHTLSVIRQLRAEDPHVCYIDLSRNFGKEAAMLAGFDYATGDCLVIMDADLQHPPHVIRDMLKIYNRGGATTSTPNGLPEAKKVGCVRSCLCSTIASCKRQRA